MYFFHFLFCLDRFIILIFHCCLLLFCSTSFFFFGCCCNFQNVFSLIKPGAFCKYSTVFTSFRVFCSSLSSAICIVSICSLCRFNDLSDSSVCIPRFFRIFFIFLKSAIFLHYLPLLRLLSHSIFISIILSDHLSYLICWGIDQILLTFPFHSITLSFLYA